MKISKEIYYHANSGYEVNIGDILIFNGDKYNKMYEGIYNSEFKLNGLDANELLINKKKNIDYSLSPEELEMVINTVNNDAYVLRELALEEIRKTKYPSYPSRLNALYVTKNKEDAFTWSSILKRNKKVCKQILTLELTGELFVGDGNIIKRQNISFQKQLDNADIYWSGKTSENPEYLFYGEARVVDIENI